MALISCYNILTSLTILMIFLPFHLEAYYTTNTGCHHNGTWYADKSLVPTTEKCLNCQCNKKTLVCRLKVCPEMPMPPPRGCVVVQKKNTCCPYLSCARLDAFYKIPATRRIIAYLDHYERESIDRVVNENMLQRRSDDTDVELYVCVKNGTVYKSGSAMSSSNLCSYCYCIGGTEKCVKPKCMLPVEGCKPIFVDSTCCPVRYDCSSKQTGKSSQEVRYRKTSNKHYMRMSQRLQRNHGCTVGQQFYTEGQKMKTDKDKPCDICFCIRGQRKCAPKKCAPALRNCIPVVPKGQCCPSSYDCGSQRDYRRSQNSRQFNLFSLLFGKDEENDENAATELAAQYPHDREPVASLPPAKYKDSTTEKSFYDTLREGLEFIDNNNNQMIKDNMDLIDIPHNRPVRPSPTPIPLQAINNIPSTTEASFLDLLLGPAEISQQQIENSSEEAETLEEKTTAVNTGNINWVDILLAPDEEDLINETSTISEKTDKTDATGGDFEITTSTDRVDENETVTENEESVAEEEELMVSTTDKSLITTTESAAKDDATQIYANNLISETTLNSTKFTQPTTQKILITTKQPAAMSTTTTTYTLTAKPPIYSSTTTKKPSPLNQTLTQTSIASALATKVSQQNIVNKNHTQAKPEKNSDFLSQLLDGLSDILGRENKTRISAQHTGINKLNTNKTLISVKLPTPKPMPMFKPLPQDKVYTRINSKIANLTVRPPIISTKDFTIKPTFKPLPTKDATSLSMATREKFKTTTSLTPKTTATKATGNATTTTTTATIVTPITSSTLKPVLIKTNPSILESEPLDQNAEPTLPPSLPNLKIIPFLPTDAVKADHNQAASYEFYHHSAAPIARIDYELYDDANLYPSITEKYPLYPDLEDGSKAEYIYKFNVEGPDSLVTSNAGNFEGTLGSPAFLKYDFAGTPSSTKGFSPPIKTEGGFVPKEPLILDDDDHDNVSVKVVDSYHVTQHIIDITTAANILNTTKVIEITTPDPFKDVIRTEPPPDLTSLIEDKLKNLISKSNTTTTTELTTIITTNKQANGKPQNLTDTKSTMTFKTATQIKMTATHIGNNNEINRTPTVVGIDNNKMQHKIKQELGDDMNDEANINVNDVSTIPPFKTLPKAPQLIVHDYTSKESASKELAAAKSQTNNKLKQTETTISPIGSAPTKITTTATTMKRPVIANATAIKVNRNKTTNTIKQTQLQQQQQQQQQKPIKINKNSTLSGSEIKILASLPTTITTKRTSLSSSSSALPSSSSFNGSTGTVSTFKTKSNATLQVTSTKATQHHHHHKPTTNKTETLPTSITHSTPKTNTINIDRTFVATRRPQKPTPNAKVQAKSKPTSPTTKKTITTKPTTTIRTTTSIPSTSTSTLTTVTAAAAAPPAATSALLQRVPNKNPFFMSPFDKLPFMDASFEVKRKSATPPTTTTATTASSPQHFAVAATIATDDLLDGANDEQQDKDNNNNGDKFDSFTSASHKLMGLVHYKHTLNQMEGLEPTTQYRPQPSISTTTNSYHGNAQFSSRVSSPSSVATQQQQQQSSSLNSLIDPTGILKLAGCNIYGRMYRVGRIILELSSPCLECKCTEIGVKCGPLDC